MHSSSRGGLRGLTVLSAAFLISCGGNTGTGSSTPGATTTVISGTSAIASGTPATVTISLLAGGLGGATFANGTGTATRFNHPGGIVVDSHGNTFVADTLNDVIREISPAGEVSTFAGIVGVAGISDGQGTNAGFNAPQGLAIDSQDSIYVADTGNEIIRKIASDGTVSTLAGTAGYSGYADTNGIYAVLFNHPAGLAVDLAQNVYVADSSNNLIRKITPGGVVTTLAGTTTAGAANGPVSSATFRSPKGVAVNSLGDVFVADLGNYSIREISHTGNVSTIAGTTNMPGSIDGAGTAALFTNPSALALDGAGNIYVADGNVVRLIDSTAAVTSVAGKSSIAGTTDGNGTAARFNGLGALALDSSGTLHLADSKNSLIRTMNANKDVVTVAGSGSPFGTTEQTGTADGQASAARFRLPTGLSVDSTGNVYVADSANYTIRQISPAGVVSTRAGVAGTAGATNGAAINATFAIPTGTAVSSAGIIYVADDFNNTIRTISPAGVVGVLAGLAGSPGTTDGQGTTARLNAPLAVALSSDGTLYVSDTGNSTIRKITPAGVVSTLAGQAGTIGFSDGAGTAAHFNSPAGLAVDPQGNIYVADANNNAIRKVTPDGNVTTLAGSYLSHGASDGIGSAASFNGPVGLVVDSTGQFLYVADTYNFSVRRVQLSDGTVTTVAGKAGIKGVVPGTGGSLSTLYGIAIDSSDNLYVTAENSILKISLLDKPDVALTATPLALSLGQSTTLNWWSSINTSSCAAADAWAGSQKTIGAMTVTPTALGSTTYSLTCVAADGSSASRSVSVSVSPAPPLPALSLSASPSTVSLGQSSTLTWTSANSAACGASVGWDGNEPVNGTFVVTPSTTGVFTYTLNCTNSDASASIVRSATITVTAATTTTTSTDRSSSSSSGGATGLDLLAGLGLLGLLRRSRRAAP